jgi:hypothetical protein
LNFAERFSKNPKILNVMKICPVGAQLFHEQTQMDRQTGMKKLIVAVGNFANAPTKAITLFET